MRVVRKHNQLVHTIEIGKVVLQEMEIMEIKKNNKVQNMNMY